MSDNDLLLDLGPNTSGDEDVDYAAPRTPSYCPPMDTEEHMMEDEQNDAYETSPPPSQPRPPARNTNENNPRDQKQPENRGIKRKYVDHQSMEAKIDKTEDSILKLERDLNNRTCPKSLQYSAKANIAPDSPFQKEIKDIKQTAEQALVNALTRFHKRRLDSLRNKLESRPTFSSRKRTHVNRQSRSESQSASNIVNNDNVKLAELEKRIIDLTNIVSTHVISTNKRVESYNIVFSEPSATTTNLFKSNCLSRNQRGRMRQKNATHRRQTAQRETNKKFLKNFSSHQLTDNQVSVISKGLKFIPTPVTDETKIRHQLLQDFEQFARRMRLQYIFHGQNKEPHPFHVKSNWIPPVQPSVTLESYLESVKVQLAEIKTIKPEYNLSRNEFRAIAELKHNSALNLKKADKGTMTVIMIETDKIKEAQVLLDNREHYNPLRQPMVKDTQQRVNQIITQLHQGNHIDDMTAKWLSQTPSPPRIPIFYTLTKIHKPKPVGRPIISGCEGPTERISSFVDRLLQPIAQRQKSYIKDSTDFINFVERTKVPQDTILVCMDVASLYTNIPQEEGITTVCQAYDTFHNNNPPIPTKYLREMLDLILKENSFQFNGENYLQTHGTAMGTKMAIAFANIFMAEFETKLIGQSRIKPIEWKRYIDDVFSLWNKGKQDINLFIEQANQFHPSIKFTADISENEITFLDTIIYKGDRFQTDSILDIKTHYKTTETFQYTHFTSCHPQGVKQGFIKGEATRLLRTNSSQTTFEECLSNFKLRLKARGYPDNFIERSLTGVRFVDRRLALQQRKKTQTKKIWPFVTTYHPAVRGLKEILMNNWVVIQNQPLLKSIYTKPPIISYKRGKSLKDTLVRVKM